MKKLLRIQSPSQVEFIEMLTNAKVKGKEWHYQFFLSTRWHIIWAEINF